MMKRGEVAIRLPKNQPNTELGQISRKRQLLTMVGPIASATGKDADLQTLGPIVRQHQGITVAGAWRHSPAIRSRGPRIASSWSRR